MGSYGCMVLSYNMNTRKKSLGPASSQTIFGEPLQDQWFIHKQELAALGKSNQTVPIDQRRKIFVKATNFKKRGPTRHEHLRADEALTKKDS
jgi:hypothetical protein